MSRILAIESSYETCSIALLDGDEVTQRTFSEPRRHGDFILTAIESLVADGGLQLADLDALAFARGPGSFTGLRLGIGVVQGLAWGSGVGVVPVSSLQALALSAVRTAQIPESAVQVAVAMDARMDEVFCGLFSCAPGRLPEPVADPGGTERVLPPEAAIEFLFGRHTPSDPAEALIAAGNGFERYEPLCAWVEETSQTGRVVSVNAPPDAGCVALLARDWLDANDPLPAHQAQPVYVRDKVADKPG